MQEFSIIFMASVYGVLPTNEAQYVVRANALYIKVYNINDSIIFDDFDIEELHMVMELGSTTSIKSAIMGGLGISTISKWAIQDLVKTGKVATLTIDGLTLKRTFNIILNKEKFHSEATGKFLDFLDMENVNQILTAK